MFDRYSLKSDNNRTLMFQMIENGDYLKFSNLNKLSKACYLYWLNENKKHCSLAGKSSHINNFIYKFEDCIPYKSIYNMLVRNQDKIYKPLVGIIK